MLFRSYHYDTVGAALLWALEREVGATFTPEVRSAWSEFYGLVTGVMKEAAGEPEKPGEGLAATP